jgi:hypothetical protein
VIFVTNQESPIPHLCAFLKKNAMKKNYGRFAAPAIGLFLCSICFGSEVYSQQATTPLVNLIAGNPDQGLQAVYIQPIEKDRLRIFVFNPDKQQVTITISNSTDVDFRVDTRDQCYDRIFNLEQVNDGWYTIEVTAGREKVKKEILLRTVDLEERRMIVKSYSRD